MSGGSFIDQVGHEIGRELVSIAIGSAVTTVVGTTRWYLSRRLPARRIWRYESVDDLMVVMSSSALLNTGVYQRPMTGIGQIRSLSLLSAPLSRAFRHVDLERIRLADSVHGEDYERNLLILGGPKTNRVAEQMLTHLPSLPFGMAGTVITWGNTAYEGRASSGTVVTDYGFVVRAPNPFAPEKRIVMLAGSHTFGNVAAARWLAKNGDSRKLPANVAVLVEAEVMPDGHVMFPRLLAQQPLS